MSPLSRSALGCLVHARARSLLVLFTLSLAPASLAAQTAASDSLHALREAVHGARVADDSTALADAVHRLGIKHWLTESYDSALVHLIAARELRRALHDTAGLARALNSIGSTHYQAGHYGPALESFLRSLALRRALGDQRGIALTMANIGKTYQDWNQFERALPMLRGAVAAAEASGDAAALGYALHSLGMVLIDVGEYAEARTTFNASLVAYTRVGPSLTPVDSTSGWSLNALALGKLDLLENRGDEAIARFDSVLARALAGRTVRGETVARLALGSAHLASGRAPRAADEFSRALALAARLEQRALRLEALAGLADAEEARGNARAALTHLRAHRLLSDSIFDRTTAQRVAAMELEFQAEEQRRATAALVETQRLQAESLARQRLVTALSIALLALTGALAFVLWRYNRMAREQAVQLERANTELAATNGELRAALAEVRTLTGFIPICAHCKRVRDDDGYWKAVETYISSRSDALFSHAICHTCGPALYGDDWESSEAERAAAEAARRPATPHAPGTTPAS